MESTHELKEALLGDFEDHEEKYAASIKKHRRLHCASVFPWVWVLILSVSLALSILRLSYGPYVHELCYWKESESSSVWDGFPRTTQQVRFDAKLKYNESRQLFRPHSTPSYVGKPSPEIDTAWAGILGVIQIFLTPEEARTLDGEMYLDKDTGMPMAIVTAFHDLHCLNMLRKALYPDYYPEMRKKEGFEAHLDHCLDSLRLTLMCDADTTLIPVEWSNEGNRIMPKFETTHTCRDYGALKEWATERDSVDEKKYRENAARLRVKAGLPPFS
ncbi:hypothetical protein SUNI508_00524 [Seiridium unicorne]|uniref:Cyclochlorotine biosynthesis protein O n=1 Tax=Seiridium unicorne TaxID=138068 RepID=A0ABR2V7A1_9PEZI